jgi:hypothetical protein
VVAAAIHSLTRQITTDHLRNTNSVEALENVTHDMKHANRVSSRTVSQLKSEISALNTNIANQTEVIEDLVSAVSSLTGTLKGIKSTFEVALAGACASLNAFSAAMAPTTSHAPTSSLGEAKEDAPPTIASKVVAMPSVDRNQSDKDCHDEWTHQQDVTNANLGSRQAAYPYFDEPMRRMYSHQKIRTPFRNRSNEYRVSRGKFRGQFKPSRRAGRNLRY